MNAFGLSKRPHLHKAYLVTVCKQGAIALCKHYQVGLQNTELIPES